MEYPEAASHRTEDGLLKRVSLECIAVKVANLATYSLRKASFQLKSVRKSEVADQCRSLWLRNLARSFMQLSKPDALKQLPWEARSERLRDAAANEGVAPEATGVGQLGRTWNHDTAAFHSLVHITGRVEGRPGLPSSDLELSVA